MLAAMFGEAWHAMGANRMRSALTMLGMVIGVGSVVLMMSIGQGAQYAVAQTISTMGSNLYIILAGSTSTGGVRSGSGYGFTLTVADAQAISELDDVATVAPVHQGTQQVIYGSRNWSSVIVGSSPDYLTARSWELLDGHVFGDSDVRSATRVALIGKTVVENLFLPDENPIGKTIRIRQTPFTVIGTLASKGQSLGGSDQDDVIIIPLSTAQRKVFGVPFVGSVRSIMVQAESAEVMPLVEKSVTALLRQRHRLREDADNDFSVRNLAAVADSVAQTTRIMSLLLGAIASVSLLVGGIGIMNIMLVSVTERTREIGIRRAVGARQRDILAQFLLEAIMISITGCLIGIVVGLSGALVVSALTEMAIIISGSSVFIAFGVAASIGIFFGFYPARKAAALDPIEALRYQ